MGLSEYIMVLGHSKLIFSFGPPLASVFHDSIYEDSAVICVNFHGGNDCCAVLKSGTKFYMYVSTDLVNSFHHPPRLLLRCHQTPGELSDTL